MKEHILQQLTNELRDIAIKYHAHQSLRELIGICINKHFLLNARWAIEESIKISNSAE